MTVSPNLLSKVDPSLHPFLDSFPSLEIPTDSDNPSYLGQYRRLSDRTGVSDSFPRKAQLPNGLAFKPIIIDRSQIKLDHDYQDRAWLDVRFYDVAPWLAARQNQSQNQDENEEQEKVPQPAIIYFHAGSLVAGSSDMFDEFLHKLALESGCKVFSVEYRLAPERSFPAAILDSVLAIEYVMHLSSNLNVDPNSIALLGSGSGGSDLVFLAAAHQIRRQKLTKLPSVKLLIASSSTGGLPGFTSATAQEEVKGKTKVSDAPAILSTSDPDFQEEIQQHLFTTTEMSLLMEGNEFGQWKSLSLVDDSVRKNLPNTFMIVPGCDAGKEGALNLLGVLQEARVKSRSLIVDGAVHLSMELFPDAAISVQMRQALIEELREGLI